MVGNIIENRKNLAGTITERWFMRPQSKQSTYTIKHFNNTNRKKYNYNTEM